MWGAQTTRNPMLLFRLFGWLLLRLAQRALFWLLFQDPPRKARVTSQGAPPAEAGILFLSQNPAHSRKIAPGALRAPMPLTRQTVNSNSKDGGRANYPKPDAVVPVVRVVEAAVGAAREVLVVVPGPAAQSTRLLA